MRFHLDHIPERQGFEIDHRQQLFLTGSCFSENIGALLSRHKFNTCTDPSGILFNPLSIGQGLQQLLEPREPDEKYIVERNGIFLSYHHHSSRYNRDKEKLLAGIFEDRKTASVFLKTTDHLIITFGTAFSYKHLLLNETVANCHKQPASTFEKTLSSAEEITGLYKTLIPQLLQVNPKLKIIFTVSPVKHLRDGLVENTLSKSILLVSIHQIIRQNSQCFYFPAYELVNDDLRDYRFYKKDLAHPSEEAIEYVWQKFSECFFSEGTQLLNKKINQLNAALDHQVMTPGSMEAHKLREFISKQKTEIRKLNPDLGM